MLSTNNWRKKSANQMLHDLDPYLSQLPIVSVNDISFSELVPCSTYEIRKEYSVSGYPNLGKGFSPEEAKLSGLMESLEMCFIESLIPIEWYSPTLKSLILNRHSIGESTNVRLSAYLGDIKCIDINDLIVGQCQHYGHHAKGFTNGLASGQFLDDSIVHSVYELIERHMIGSQTRIRLKLSLLSQELQSFLSKIEQLGLTCNIYFRGQYANTITVESHIIDNSLTSISQPYGGVGFGCSGDSNIAIARAISEAFQCLSMAKSVYFKNYGLGTDLTGPIYGYSKDLNNFYASSLKMVPQIKFCKESSTSNLDFQLSIFNRVHTHDHLICDLVNEGITQFHYIVLTKSDLPFTVVRCFIDQLSNSYSI